MTSAQDTSGRASARATARGVGRAHDHGGALGVRRAERVEVVDRLDDERALELERALERDRGDAAPRRAEPALPHRSSVSPGDGASSSTPCGRSGRSASGVPLRIGNVP